MGFLKPANNSDNAQAVYAMVSVPAVSNHIHYELHSMSSYWAGKHLVRPRSRRSPGGAHRARPGTHRTLPCCRATPWRAGSTGKGPSDCSGAAISPQRACHGDLHGPIEHSRDVRTCCPCCTRPSDPGWPCLSAAAPLAGCFQGARWPVLQHACLPDVRRQHARPASCRSDECLYAADGTMHVLSAPGRRPLYVPPVPLASFTWPVSSSDVKLLSGSMPSVPLRCRNALIRAETDMSRRVLLMALRARPRAGAKRTQCAAAEPAAGAA